MDVNHWKHEAIEYGKLIINELDEPDKYEAHVSSDSLFKYFHIVDKQACTTIYTISEPTYHDLFKAVRFAWNMYEFMKRGFA